MWFTVSNTLELTYQIAEVGTGKYHEFESMQPLSTTQGWEVGAFVIDVRIVQTPL